MSAEGIIGDARSLIGSPQVQTPKAVAPAPVNTPEQAAAPTTAAKEAAQASSTANTDMMVVLQNMLQVMQANLVAETKQADNSDAMLRALRPGAVFADSQQLANQLLKRGNA